MSGCSAMSDVHHTKLEQHVHIRTVHYYSCSVQNIAALKKLVSQEYIILARPLGVCTLTHGNNLQLHKEIFNI